LATSRRTFGIIGAAIAATIIVSIASYYYLNNNATSNKMGDLGNQVNNIPTVYPANATLNGVTYGELTAKWWQSRLGIASERNPISDTSGEHCSEGQSGNTWFLDGTFGGPVDRTCQIPSGKYILFPVMNAMCDYAEYPELKSEPELRKCAIEANDGVTELMVSIDGKRLSESELRRDKVTSPIFSLTLPEDNILGLPPGETQGVSDGFWVLTDPLTPGDHEIHFRGVIPDFSAGGTNNFVTEARYHITVQ